MIRAKVCLTSGLIVFWLVMFFLGGAGFINRRSKHHQEWKPIDK